MFPEEITAGVRLLQEKYKTHKARDYVVMNFPIVEIIKYHKDREISVKLFYFPMSKTFEMKPPDQRFYSKNSYYDFNKPERRWLRNRDFIFTLVRDLKSCNLWEYVSNQDTIVVNVFNKRSDPEKLKDILKDLIG